MRKTTAIFLLIIYVYNLIGYKAVFSYLEQKATSSLVSKLDKGQYSDEELFEMKIPYTSLYHSDWTEYVRYDGNIEIDGHHYNYVKRKFANDTLYLLCIPNKINTNLASVKINYYDNTPEGDNSIPKKSKPGSVNGTKCFSSDCNFLVSSFELQLPQQIVDHHFITTNEKLPVKLASSLYKPPRLLA